ncbi:retinoic acid receptor RXR-alpha-B isoform X1 [Tachysurus ichikawai]
MQTGFLKSPCSVAPPCVQGRLGDAGSSPSGCYCFTGTCPLHHRRISTDSSGQQSSSPLSSPTGHRSVGPHALHPSLLTPSSIGSTPGQLHSPINGLTSPFPVISSAMGHPNITGPSSTSMAFGPSLSPQPNDPVTNICQAADKQLFTLVEWAKRIPHFSDLPLDDQVILLRAGWNELLIASFSHRSISVKDGILLATGLHVHRNSAHSAGVGAIFDRVLTELVSKMRDMQMDKSELGCLRAIVLFNPDSKGLSNPTEVEALRERVYASLEAYCKQKYPDQPGRFAKLLLRLPALRSIGLKCLEHLFFFKLIGDTPIDTFLMEMLEAPHQMT